MSVENDWEPDMSIPFPGSPDDMMNTIAELRARVAKLEAALEPFVQNVSAASLREALGHIEREHLLAARAALKEFAPVKADAPQ
jgi:hypothetical protein